MKALVIYNEIPDQCRFFCLQNPRVDEVLMLENLQGVTINNDELSEMQDASLSMLQAKIEGTDDRIPEWECSANTSSDNWKEELKRNVEIFQPDRIFYIVFLL
jgi:hypothetical protein